MISVYRKILDLMTNAERRRFWLLVGVTFSLSALEAASVLSILPFLQLLADPELIETNVYLNWAYTSFGFTSSRSFLIAMGVAVFLVTFFGLAMKMLTVWITTRFALMRSFSISSRLLTGYLRQPYEWFLTRHSAELGNAILAEVDQVVRLALLPAIRLIPETFTVVLLVAALCLMEPWIALGAAVLLGGVYGTLFISVKRLLARLGQQRMDANRTRFHTVQEATGGVKELKIMGLEEGFTHRFRGAAFLMARSQTRSQVISNVPRYALEAVAFGGMILLILVLLIRGDGSLATLIPTLGLIAAISLRLIPALQQIYSRGSSLKQAEAALDRIHGDMTTLGGTPPPPGHPDDRLPLTETLELENVRYGYPNAERSALDGLSLSIKANTTIGIVGGTGAGKTTVVDIILGLLDPAEGEMRVDGTVISSENRRAWQKTLGYVPQTIFLSDGSVAENIAFGVTKDEIDYEAVERAARIAALHDFVMSDLPDGYDTAVGERGVRLSGGQRQRIGIARALYRDPAMLILDEATSALDTLTEAAVMEAVTNIAGQKTVVMIAHRLSTVRECDQIFLLKHGKVAAAGRFDELVEQSQEFQKMAAAGATAT